MPSRLPAALVAAVLLTAACETASPLDRDEPIRISAGVVDDAGAPLPDAPARLLAGVSGSDLLMGPLLLLCPPPCAGIDDEQRTDAEGRVVFTGTAGATQTGLGGARDLSLVVQDPEDARAPALARGSVVHGFQLLAPDLELPSVPFWRTGLTATADGARLRLGFDPGPHDGPLTYTWQVADLQGNLLATARDVAPGAAVDARPLEDRAGRMVVIAAATAATASGEVTTRWRSPVHPVRGALAPPSRGAACSHLGPDGAPVVQAPCGLTDGNPLTPGPEPTGSCADVAAEEQAACRERVAAVQLDLGSARPVDLVVVRGGDAGTTVATSTDGARWQAVEVEAGTATDVLVLALPSRSARFVRVGVADRTPTEVSVW